MLIVVPPLIQIATFIPEVIVPLAESGQEFGNVRIDWLPLKLNKGANLEEFIQTPSLKNL